MSKNGDKVEAILDQAKLKMEELMRLQETINDSDKFEAISKECNFNITEYTIQLEQMNLEIETWKSSHNGKSLIGNLYPFFEYINKNRKISKFEYQEVEDALVDVVRYINNINSLPEDATMLPGFNRHLNECFIMNMFKDWIRPKSIRYILGDLKCIDLLDRPEYLGWEVEYSNGTKRVLTYNQLLIDWMVIARHFKMDYTQMLVSVESLRRDVTFNDILSIASIKGKVNYQNNAFIPVPLGDECALFFHDAYFNATSEEVINDWFITFEM